MHTHTKTSSFSKTLIFWYLQNKRDLPWRNTTNPYFIWLSEIILQQTRVNQGLEYYLRFIETFPSVKDLADADEEAVLKLWQGLGYYSRARNLHFSANYVMNELNGEFPTTYKELLKLRGVGDYTASAIASICNNESTAVVDGNVYRVLARYFGVKTPINFSKGIKEFKELAQKLIDKDEPGNYNQAIMEFGATQCKPQNPDCNNCPLNSGCFAFANNTVDSLPVKENKLKIKKRYFNYIVLIDTHNQTKISIRNKKGIWQGLYEFPLIETSSEIHPEELVQSEEFQSIVDQHNFKLSTFNQQSIVHKLSHQHLYTKFWVVNCKEKLNNAILWDDFENYPVPILIHNFVASFKDNV
ncbi:MAG: A/G-specific adenine glycosylase [Flavobacteriaceae bacterium]|nr:A/G-specific adenine glycosylase [Flavobacteriaceae bacterium]